MAKCVSLHVFGELHGVAVTRDLLSQSLRLLLAYGGRGVYKHFTTTLTVRNKTQQISITNTSEGGGVVEEGV